MSKKIVDGAQPQLDSIIHRTILIIYFNALLVMFFRITIATSLQHAYHTIPNNNISSQIASYCCYNNTYYEAKYIIIFT